MISTAWYWLFIYLHYGRRLSIWYCIFCRERVGRRCQVLGFELRGESLPWEGVGDGMAVLSLRGR